MPFYECDLIVPAGTPAVAPAQSTARLNRGVITGVDVQFPSGCAGLVFTRARREGAQVFPTNPDGSIKTDGLTVRWDEDYPIEDAPLFFVLEGWSPAARFPHTVTWRFELTPLARAEELRAAPGLLQGIARYLGLGR